MTTNIDSLKISNRNVETTVKTNTAASTNSTFIPLVSEEALKSNGIGDNLNTSNTVAQKKSIDEVYKKIAEICEEYRFSIQDAKECKLLEAISGKTTEQLLVASDAELNNMVKALKDALGMTGHWEWIWSNRDKDDIKEIAADAQKRYIRIQTGGNWLGQKIHDLNTKNTLTEELKSAGCLNENTNDVAVLKEAVKKYFVAEYLQDIKTLSKEEQIKKYETALTNFGYLINKYETPQEKALLTAVIEELKSDKRYLAAKVMVESCGTDSNAKTIVAKEIVKSHKSIVTKKDALNETVKKDDAVALAHVGFQHMTEEDVKAALELLKEDSVEFLNKHGEKIAELKARKENGKVLTDEELALLTEFENVYVAQHAGATTGTIENIVIEKNTKTEILEIIIQNTEEIGIQQEVLVTVAEQLEKQPELLTKSTEEVTKILDKATENKFSEVVENLKELQTIKNGAKEISVKSETKVETKTGVAESKEEKVSGNLGFNTRKGVDKTKLEDLTSKIYQARVTAPQELNIQKTEVLNEETLNAGAQNSDVSSKNDTQISVQNIVKIARMNKDDFDNYLVSNGTLKTVKEVFNNLKYISNQAVILQAVNIYKNMSNSIQADILKNVNNSGLKELLGHTSDATLMALKGETFSNFWATKQVAEAVEDVEENIA